jgi:hypothetical protein
MGFVFSVAELLALKEWWGTEHTVMLIWLTLCLPAFWKRSSGNCNDIFLQLVSGLSGLMVFGSFVQLATGLQSGAVFGGKFSMPTLALLGVVVMMFGANLEGIKKEIYGYGVNDVPSDEKPALVFDSIKKFIGIETVIFFSIATFGLPSLDVASEDYDYLPWLSIFPVCGMITAMNTYFSPEKVVADVTPDVNGLPPQPKEVEGKEVNAEKEADAPAKEEEDKNEAEKKEPEAKPETTKEAVEGAEPQEKSEENGDEKVDSEPKEPTPSIICKAITKVKGLLTSILNVVLAVVGKVTSFISCVVEKATSFISCILNRILALPWNCITGMVICLGTKVTLTYSLWYLTEDIVVFAFPVIDVVLPVLVAKAKERQWLTDNAGHIVAESASLVASCTHYYLFRTYSAATPI